MNYWDASDMQNLARGGGYAYIIGYQANLSVTVVQEDTGNLVAQAVTQSIKAFMKDFKKIFKGYKAIIINIELLVTLEYLNNLTLKDELRQLLTDMKIPYYFTHDGVYFAMAFLAGANVTIPFDEMVLIVNVSINGISVIELRRVMDGYEVMCERDVPTENGDTPERLKAKIMGSCHPTRIILFAMQAMAAMFKHLKIVLKSKKLIALNGIITEYKIKFIYEMGKWIIDRSNNKFFIHPICNRTFYVLPPNCKKEDAWITMNKNERLPLEKVCYVSRLTEEFYLAYEKDNQVNALSFIPKSTVKGNDELSWVQHHQVLLDLKNSHKMKITYSIDEQNFFNITKEPVTLTEIESLPTTLDDKITDEKIPVIGFFDNSSVICTCTNENGKYEFLDEWNGLYGKNLILRGEAEKPTFISSPNVNGFPVAIYDFIKIMSMPPDKIKVDPNWKFVITKDSNNPVLIEYEASNKTKNAASLAFLLALILKEKIKAIKSKIGTKPKKFGFVLFDDFEAEARKRIETQIEESCKLMNLECCFIKI